MSDTDSDFETSSYVSALSSASSATVTKDRGIRAVEAFQFVEEARALRKGGWLEDRNHRRNDRNLKGSESTIDV